MSYTATNAAKTNELISFASHQEELDFLNKAMEKDSEGHILNEEAWNAFYNQYNRFAFTIANKILRDEDEAEDVMHEVFIKCLKEFGQYKQDQPFKPWLSAVVKNFCINELKKKNAKPTHYIGAISADDCFNQEEDDSVYFCAIDNKTKSPYENAVIAERNSVLNKVMAKLKPDFREVIELKYFEGMSYEKIAEKINKPIGTVMSRLFNARKKMKEIFKETTGQAMAELKD